MPIGVNKYYTEEMKADVDFNTEILADDVVENKEFVNGNFSYLDAGAEQVIFEIIDRQDQVYINQIMLDLSNMAQNGTIKLYSKIDGKNYQLVNSTAFTFATSSKGQLINLKITLNTAFKATYTEGANEGADRIIPFSYILED